MVYDHQEQEQLDELKSWWKEHGNSVLLGFAMAALVIAGVQAWRYHQRGQIVAAATLYEQLDLADRAGDRKKVRDIADQITSGYASTSFGTYAALAAARASFDVGDLADARSRLLWVLGHAKEDEVRDMARLRLAAVFLDEKNYAEAMKQLEANPVEPMAGLYADMKGDIFSAQGKKAEARSAYQLALDRSDAGSLYRPVIQIKLDALGDAK